MQEKDQGVFLTLRYALCVECGIEPVKVEKSNSSFKKKACFLQNTLAFGFCSFACLQKANNPSRRVFQLLVNFREEIKTSPATRIAEAIKSGNHSHLLWLQKSVEHQVLQCAVASCRSSDSMAASCFRHRLTSEE